MSAYRRNIGLNYILSFFLFANLAASTIVVFLQDNGLSVAQIFILQAIGPLVILLSELPTGVFADVSGRKKSIVVACVLFGLASFLTIFSHSFFSFLFVLSLAAFGSTFYSGSGDALMYDSLREERRTRFAKLAFSNNALFRLIGLGSAVILGAFIASINYRLNFALMSVISLIALFVALKFKEPESTARIKAKTVWKETINAITLMLHVRPYVILMLALAVLSNISLVILIYIQFYLAGFGVNLFLFGFVYAALAIMQGVGVKVGSFIETFLKPKYFSILVMILYAASLGLLGISDSLVFFLVNAHLFMFVSGLFGAVFADYQNRFVPSMTRATIGSFSAIVNSFIFVLIIIPVGLASELFGLGAGVLLVALISLSIIPALGLRIDDDIILKSVDDGL
ncbi:hypothetical protein COT72_04150 [archaeon CG10_big_fil_rev_8_21_14_0_10_43_11]|nr:MAG: hypothetical protein COT72_04150 [archaeon CG10_big_fil_rev_8_21_14_0_10_43_11]